MTIAATSQELRGLLVLGMHRSGTSVATRLVNLLGPSTCTREELIGWAPWNPRGLWECRSLIRLNEELLRSTGHTWWYPPPAGERYWEAVASIGRFADLGREAFDRAHPDAPWVWKDPRACLLVPFWRQVLGPCAGVLIYRHPLDVAASLRRRNRMPLDFGLALWERYNRLLLEHCGGMPLIVVCYDDVIDDVLGSAERVRAFLAESGVRAPAHPNAEAIRELVDPELRHAELGSSGGPNLCGADRALQTFEMLEAHKEASTCFQPPELSTEPGWVPATLASMGPNRVPAWNEPPE